MPAPQSELNIPAEKEHRSSVSTVAFTAIGVVMVAASFLAMSIEMPFAFCVTALAWGSINIALAQVFRVMEELRRLENQRIALQLDGTERIERERGQVLDRLAASGALTNVSLPEISGYLEVRPGEEVAIERENGG